MLRPDWKTKAKTSWTVRINAFATALLSWMWFDPVTLLSVWNMMPPAIRPVLPQNLIIIGGITLFVLSMLARLRAKPEGVR